MTFPSQPTLSWTLMEYTPSHTAELRRIYLQARLVAFPWIDPSDFLLQDFDTVTKGEQLLVAVQQGVPIGFVAWWPPDNFIHSLFVDPAFMGKGVGKSLLEACLAQLGRPATLKCLQQNTNAVGFYLAQGGTVVWDGESRDGPFLVFSFAVGA